MNEVPTHRLVGLLAEVVRSGALPVSSAQHAEVSELVERWMVADLALERFALDVHEALRHHQIDHRFLKGLALAHRWYERPDLRVFGDIDVTINAADIPTAFDLLAEVAGPRMEPELRPGFDVEFGKGATFKSAIGNELDVHRTLVWGAYGLTVVPADLFDAPTSIRVASVELPVPAPGVVFLHACYSAVLGDVPPRLVALRDVVETLPRDEPTAARAIELATRWRARAVVALAVRWAQETLLVDLDGPLADWARAYRPSPSERLLLRSHLMPGGTYARRVSAVAVVPGMGPRLRYLRALAWPDRTYLDARGFSWATHVKRSLRFADPRRLVSSSED